MEVNDDDDDEDMGPVTTTRLKRNNPNVSEVFEAVNLSPEDRDQISKKRAAAIPVSGGAVGSEYDNLLGKYVRPRIGLGVAPDYSSKEKEEEEEADPAPSGYATTTTTTTTPMTAAQMYAAKEVVNFEAAKRQLEARAKLMSDPMIEFVAGIAVKTGTGLSNMLMNPSLPLVNMAATSIGDLVNGSRFPRDAIMVLLAQLLVEQRQLLLLVSSSSGRQLASPLEELQPGTPDNGATPMATPTKSKSNGGGGGGNSNNNGPLPFVTPGNLAPPSSTGTSPTDTSSEMGIFATISSAIDLIEQHALGGGGGTEGYDLIGPPMVPFGNRPAAAGGAAAGPVSDGILSLLREVSATSEVTSWAWYQMPEHSGLALIKPEVVAIIQTAYEDIRAISGAHGEFKLWHLITGPRVRHHFAMMIAGMLNAAPSEIQYPHYQRSVRDNGAVTGARVSNGVMSAIRNASLYKEKLQWFRFVGYQESAAWKTLRDRHMAGQARSDLAIQQGALERAEASLVRLMDAFWTSLPADVAAMAGALYDYIAHFPGQADRIQAIQRALIDASPRQAAPTVGRMVMVNVTGLVPFAPRYEAGVAAQTRYTTIGGVQFDFARGPIVRLIGHFEKESREVLLKACEMALRDLYAISGRISIWAGVDEYRQIMYNLTEAFSLYKASIASVHAARRQVAIDQHQMASFTEDAKRELVYSRIEQRPPMRDYSLPYSQYAQE